VREDLRPLPFKMSVAYVKQVRAMSKEQLETALIREAELRAGWQMLAEQRVPVVDADRSAGEA
jgi:hypothetical protein